MWTSFLLALLPIIWLIFALAIIKMPAAKACIIGLVLTIVLAIFAFKLPLIDTLTGTLEGALMGIWPIVYVIVAALFTYNVSNESGGIKIIQDVLSSITTDQRILVLIIAWGFGGFLEAIAGFGTAVAIPAGILIAFGIEPIKASVICLIANTTPTAFGAIGLPVITLSDVTGLSVNQLSFIVTLQLALLIIIIPFILVGLTGGSFRALKGVFWITLLSGVAFALPQIFVAKLVGPELPAIVGAICCIAVTVVMAKMINKRQDKTVEAEVEHHSVGEFLRASSPFILVFCFVILASSLFPDLHQILAKVTTTFPVYTGNGAELFRINWLSSPGTLILIDTIIGGFIQKMNLIRMMQILWQTIKGIWKTAITICSIVALAKVMGYAGMTAALATALVKVMGPVYPMIAPLIGALGTFITGSDTSANVLFGNLQLSAAQNLAVNKYWLVGANMVGATAGKMISPQSIAVAAAAIGQEGSEAIILKQVMKWCLLDFIVICLFLYIVGFIIGLL